MRQGASHTVIPESYLGCAQAHLAGCISQGEYSRQFVAIKHFDTNPPPRNGAPGCTLHRDPRILFRVRSSAPYGLYGLYTVIPESY